MEEQAQGSRYRRVTKLIATIGLQASGKTTWARDWVAEDPINRVRVERDVLREMLGFGFVKENEKFVLDLRNNLIENALKCGKSVVVSDTNFPWRTIRELRSIARTNGAEFEVQDFTAVSVDICIGRDASRDPYLSGRSPVGKKVIIDFYDRYLKGKPYPYPLPPEEAETVWEPYVPTPDLPWAVIVDIDGTLAKMNGRSPYDWSRVFEDDVNESVADHVWMLKRKTSMKVILLSGRDSAARGETERWLTHYNIPYDELHMRAEGDKRRDDLVKYELFNQNIRNNYRIDYVLDDRDQVVKMWRELGLSCWQVEYGNF